MAENFDNPQFGNFSIENTMEMGMGNADLLNDLMAPETATGSPDDIKNIADEPAPAAPAKKAAAPAAEKASETEEKKDPTADIQSFLYGADEEEEEEETTPQPAKKEAPKAEETPSDTEEESEEEQVSQFTALSRDLFKLGVFSKDEDEEDVSISTPEEFLE